jgi:hypothetical protein
MLAGSGGERGEAGSVCLCGGGGRFGACSLDGRRTCMNLQVMARMKLHVQLKKRLTDIAVPRASCLNNSAATNNGIGPENGRI